MKTKYVVCESGYEYNDEVYQHHEKGGGIPRRVFDTKKEADDYALLLTLDELVGTKGHSGIEIMSHGYDVDEVFKDYGKCLEDADLCDNANDLPSDWTIPKGTPRETLVKIAEQLRISFYEVYEVDSK